MQKDELIQLHAFLLQLKINLEDIVDDFNQQAFIDYDKLEISPHQIYRSKKEHQLAVFELSKGISKMLCDNNGSIFQKIYEGLDKICNGM
jgi:hypothetical protein